MMRFSKKITKVFINTLALLPILSLKMVSVSILFFVVGSILGVDKTRMEKIKRNIKLAVLFSIPFFMYIISLLWTDNFYLGLKSVEKTLSFFIIPACVFILRPFKSQNSVKYFYKMYIIASFSLAVLTILFLLFNLDEIVEVSQQNNYILSIRIRQAIEEVPFIGEHAIYFSLIISTALLLLFYNRFKSKSINIVFAIIFILSLVIASTRGILLGALIVAVLLIFQSNKTKTKKQIILMIFFTALLGTYFISPIKVRVNEIITTKNIYPEGNRYNSFNIRMAIYDCALNTITTTPLFGFGPADVQKKLDNCYKKHKTLGFKNKHFNSHNQYFDYILSFGFIGFMPLLYWLAFFLRISIKAKNNQYFNFLILLYVSFIFENILVRNTGIILFVTFNSLLAYSSLFKKELNMQ
jgi:hypothetical protein